MEDEKLGKIYVGCETCELWNAVVDVTCNLPREFKHACSCQHAFSGRSSRYRILLLQRWCLAIYQLRPRHSLGCPLGLLIANPYETWSCFSWLCLHCDFALSGWSVFPKRPKISNGFWICILDLGFGLFLPKKNRRRPGGEKLGEAFPGFRPAQPMVYAGIFPEAGQCSWVNQWTGSNEEGFLGSTTSGQKHYMLWGEGWNFCRGCVSKTLAY